MYTSEILIYHNKKAKIDRNAENTNTVIQNNNFLNTYNSKVYWNFLFRKFGTEILKAQNVILIIPNDKYF